MQFPVEPVIVRRNRVRIMVLTHLADDELLRLVASGAEEAFSVLYRRRQGAVYRFALQMSGSSYIAEEVTQEIFLMLLTDSSSYDASRGTLASYLYGVARRLVWRRMAQSRSHFPLAVVEGEDSRTPEQLVALPEVERDLARDETLRSLRRAILALPAGYRETVVLCDLHELSYADAAEVLGCAIGTVRSRLHRARALLAERLAAKTSSASRCLV
jgi:RNA polymerase sigma-70 factor (ECF subfamily)